MVGTMDPTDFINIDNGMPTGVLDIIYDYYSDLYLQLDVMIFLIPWNSLVYLEGQSSWGREYLLSKKRLWEIQARKVIIKEGLDWWFLDRSSRGDIFTTRF